MAKKKSLKIFIKNGSVVKALMWTIMGRDGSVMMGFPWETEEVIEEVVDENIGKLEDKDLISENFTGKSKISFHQSGHSKINSRMGLKEDAIDRITVKGPSFNEIVELQHLAEIYLPEDLPDSKYIPTEKDIVLNTTSAHSLPTRCTVSCVRRGEVDGSKLNNIFYDSEWEASHAFSNDTHTWIWTARKSRYDESNVDTLSVKLLGAPKWGNTINAV